MIYQHVYKFWLFSLLDDFGNFKEAANHARITQSALSQSISALEEQLQMSLVVRERGFVRLTDEGSTLLDKVKPILHELKEMDANLHGDENIKGSLSLGAYESIAVDFLPRLFKRLSSFYPNLKLDIKTARTDDLLKSLSKGELDMALVVSPPENKKYSVDSVGVDELGLYLSSSYPNQELGLEILENIGLATLAPSTDGHPLYYKRFLKRIPVKYKSFIHCDSFETIRNLAVSGVMVGLLPNKVANRAPGELVKIWPYQDEDSEVSRHNISVVSRSSVDNRIQDLILNQFREIF